MKLNSHQYGKQKVRVMKIIRDGTLHTIKELTVGVALQGDFKSSYTAGDNSLVVATDTIKNTVQALAKDHLGLETERFLTFLAQHFTTKYPQVHTAAVTASERVWGRVEIAGAPHPHTFSASDRAEPFVSAIATAEGIKLRSGIENLLLMKSTESSFADYPRCEFTTLPEAQDRVLATSLKASWKWSAVPADYLLANAAIVRAMLVPFANHHSPSAQTTLFEMASAALAECPEIGEIHLAMPNKHFLLVPLERFGMENSNEIFLPTDEPHGQIEASVGRD
jgi:urate oxidase